MIEALGLSKQFPKLLAVNRVSFTVRPGEVFGLLGENGAGKTTTLRMLATMLKPTEGTARICGHDLLTDDQAVRATIGVLFGGEAGLYDRLTGYENIEYFGQLNEMPQDLIDRRIRMLADMFNVGEFLDRRAGKLSKGTKQKLVFARAIIHDPAVMIFDEPTSGLDVTSIAEAHQFIARCRDEGKCIILSSHTMSEVEKLCNRVGIIHRGVMQDMGTIPELTAKYNLASLEEVFTRLVGDRREA